MLDFLTMALKWVVKSPFSSVDISHQGKLSEMGGEEEEEMEARLFLTLDHVGDLVLSPPRCRHIPPRQAIPPLKTLGASLKVKCNYKHDDLRE